jgi:hypothetical protein
MHLRKLAQVFSGKIEQQWNFRLHSTLIAFFINERIADVLVHTWPEHVLSAVLRSRASLGGTMRMCPACVMEEVSRMGFPIWHLTHQFPHSFVCLFHRCLLVEIAAQGELRLPELRVPRTRCEPENEFKRLHLFSIVDRIVFNACLTSLSRKSLCLAIRGKFGHGDVGRLRALELAAAIRDVLPMRLNRYFGQPGVLENGCESLLLRDPELTENRFLTVALGFLAITNDLSEEDFPAFLGDFQPNSAPYPP